MTRCSFCGADACVNKAGLVMAHQLHNGSSWGTPTHHSDVTHCPGSGQRPLLNGTLPTKERQRTPHV